MYYCLRSVTPWLDEVSRIAGSCAYLFNMYVALNSQAQIVWLLTYATLPAMVGVTARAMRGEMNLWRAALFIALLVLVGGGINPPLVAINVDHPRDLRRGDDRLRSARRRLRRGAPWPFIVVAVDRRDRDQSLLAGAVRRFLPRRLAQRRAQRGALDAQRGDVVRQRAARPRALGDVRFVWRARVLPVGRVVRVRACSARCSGSFRSSRLGGIAFKRNQRPATLFFLIVTIVSVPIVVGYYHDALGDAVTTPIYDRLLPQLPRISDVPLLVQVGRGRRVRDQRTLRDRRRTRSSRRCASAWADDPRERWALDCVPAAASGVDRHSDLRFHSGLDEQDELSRAGASAVGVSREGTRRRTTSAIASRSSRRSISSSSIGDRRSSISRIRSSTVR